MQGLGCSYINFKNKACRPVSTIRTCMVNSNRVDLRLQGSGNICMCGSLTDLLLFLDDLLMFYHTFGVNFDVMCFLLQGCARLLGHALV